MEDLGDPVEAGEAMSVAKGEAGGGVDALADARQSKWYESEVLIGVLEGPSPCGETPVPIEAGVRVDGILAVGG